MALIGGESLLLMVTKLLKRDPKTVHDRDSGPTIVTSGPHIRDSEPGNPYFSLQMVPNNM